MSYQLLGLNELEIHKINNHLSSASTGIKYHGLVMDAMQNGFYEGFQGKSLTEYAAGTYVVAAAANQAMVKNKTYILENCSQTLFVTTANAAGTGTVDFASGAGVPDAASTNHSVFRVLCSNATTISTTNSVVIDQGDILWIPPSNNFKFGFEVAAWANRTAIRTKVMTQIGVCGVLHANKLIMSSANIDAGTNPISGGNFLYVEVAQNKVRLVHGNSTTAPTLGNQVDVPTGAFTCIVDYVAATNQAHLYVDGVLKASSTLSGWSTATGLQFFLRSGNCIGYNALGTPCDISIDSILISSPRSMS